MPAALDSYQQAFCRSESKDTRLLAPAGSGKTHSLLHRCSQVHERSGGKSKFLVVTFTRAARDELKIRLGKPPFLPIQGSIEVTTLNSWGWRRVRERHHAPKLISGKDRNFTVQNSLQPVWREFPAISAQMTKKPIPTGKILLNSLDQLKNLGFDHTRHLSQKEISAHARHLADARADALLPALAHELHEASIINRPSAQALLDEFMPFWRMSVESLINQSVFTLEDQKYVAFLNVLSQIDEGRLPLGGSKFSDVLVDEFQDISSLDLKLVKAIADLHRAGLTIVGDDDQAIFEWRGATPSYILEPDRWFGRRFETFILERNYRCPKNLVAHAQRLIRNNKNRHDKRVEARHTVDALIEVRHQADFADSIDGVVDEVDRFMNDTSPRSERMALVSRKRAQLIPYQIMLAQRNISFCAAEDLQVFLSETFETLLTMITARMEAQTRRPSHRVVEDILTLCDRVKRFPLSKSDKASLRAHLLAQRPRDAAQAISSLSSYSGKLKGDNDGGGMSLSFASALSKFYATKSVASTIDSISEFFHGMSKDYGRADEDIFFSDPPFFYLSRFADRYGDDFEAFMDDIETAAATLAHAPADDDASEESFLRPVHLMTALRAKGKEFHTVVLLDVNDGIWPMRQAETQAQLEGERRVFYVALTRAKKRLLITVSRKIGNSAALPSPFLAEAGLVPTLV